MSTFGERIRAARTQAGLTQKRLAEMIGIRACTAICNWEKDLNRPDITQLVALARALDTGLDYLLDCYDGTAGVRLTDADKELLRRYHAVDSYGREAIDAVADVEFARCSKAKRAAAAREFDSAWKYMNIYGKVAAGSGTWLPDEQPAPAKVRLDAKSRKADYAVEVSGDSMEPDFSDGDLLLVQHTSVIEPGELGIFAYDGLGYFKKLGHGELLSLNPAYDPIVPDGNVTIQGRVIGKAERVD